MASATVHANLQDFPVGTTLGAYPRSGWSNPAVPPTRGTAPPSGVSATATAAVQSDGSTTFTGLADGTTYVVGAQVSSEWRYGPTFATAPAAAALGAVTVTGGAQDTSVDQLEGYTDTLEASFATLNAKDFATQTTLAAILAKLIASPATETTLASVLTSVDGLEALLGGTLTTQRLGLATASLSNVASSASSVTVLSALSTRRSAYFFNDSTSPVYLKFGATASATSFTVKIAAAGFYELAVPIWTGRIDALWDTANGNLRVTELQT